MKQQKTLLLLVLVLAGFGLVGGVVLARGMGQEPNQWVLQKSELPDGARIVNRPLEDDDFLGPPSLVNVAIQAEGFLKGYVTEGEYPCEFRTEVAKGLVGEGSGAVGLLNVAYQFHRSEQAAAQIEQAVELIEQTSNQGNVDQYRAKIEQIDLEALLPDESIVADAKIQGQAVRVTWLEGDVEFVNHVFFGAHGRIFGFLSVHGFNDPVTQEVFEILLAKLLER